MKLALVVPFLALLACGSSSDSDSAPAPEVTRVNVDHVFCGSSIGCSVYVGATYNTGSNVAPSGYQLVVAMAPGVDPPAACDASSVNGGSTRASFDSLGLSTVYAFRACLFSAGAGTYSAGTYAVYTTQAAQ